jgi:hypothetical protein
VIRLYLIGVIMVSRTSDNSEDKMPASWYQQDAKRETKKYSRVISMRPAICALCAKWDDGTFPIPLTVCPNCMNQILQVADEVTLSYSSVLTLHPCYYCGKSTGFKMYKINTRACRACIDKIRRTTKNLTQKKAIR